MDNALFWRRALFSGLGAVAILLIGYGLMEWLGNRERPVRQMSFREATKAVQVAPVAYESREISLSGLGKVVAERAINLASEVQGQIQAGAVPLKRGTRFSRGQVLFRIDNTEARLALYAQKSDFMRQVAAILPELKLDYPDALDAWEAYFGQLDVEKSLPELPTTHTPQEKVFLSTRNIYNLFYSIQSAEARLAKYIVRAPFSGSYVDVVQEVGAAVNAGNQVARIARSQRMELEVPFRSSDLAYVRKGMEVEVIAEGGTPKWKGRLNRIGSALDPNTQAINLYVSFDPGNTAVFEGQYLRAEMPGRRVRDVMEIPRNAVFNRNQIFVVQDSSRLSVAKIEVEKVMEEKLLFSGLEKGALIVTEPLLNAYENMPVSVQSAP
ncbi:MAG: efflux RND transporter periplasmic adaptor subunit [Bacteroidota bacterium]